MVMVAVTGENVNKVFYAFVGWMAVLNAYNNLPYDSPGE